VTQLPEWPRAWGEPPVDAQLKQSPADFDVEEVLGFEPDGSGEHLWLWVEKEGLNTVDAAQRLAKFAGLREADISWGGLKDRQALTRQWFSLHLLQREVDWERWNDPVLRLLRRERHSRKLRRGAHRGNRFVITLRDVRGDVSALEQRLQRVATHGVPNYFGPQRFGRDGRNLVLAQRWVEQGQPRLKRHQQGLHLSTLRALLFNTVLGARVVAGSWRDALDGELFILDGSGSVFSEAPGDELRARLASGDIHPSGPLCGRARKVAPAAGAAAVEAAALAPFGETIAALERAGLDAERRSLRLLPQAMHWELTGDDTLRLAFTLPGGCFATSVIRELARLDRDQEPHESSE
jgi:tRNA pseudouridine13 synthase